MHQFLKFIFGIKLYMFRTFPLSIIRSFSLYTQQWYMSYRFCWQLASRIRMEPRTELVPSWSCPQAVTVTCMTYTVAVCTVKNSWWWTEKLSETCRVSLFQKQIWEISVSSWFYYKYFATNYAFYKIIKIKQMCKKCWTSVLFYLFSNSSKWYSLFAISYVMRPN